MGRRILIKLRSREGASLTFALLAFLVCAVISAVLLASASAASGRVSKLAETDQRYYAVTSAAQLFCDALEDKTTHTPKEFVIERVRTDTSVTQTKYAEIEGITFRYPVDPADLSKPDQSRTSAMPKEKPFLLTMSQRKLTSSSCDP